MRGALVIAALLLASPAAAQDVACVPDRQAADKAATNAPINNWPDAI